MKYFKTSCVAIFLCALISSSSMRAQVLINEYSCSNVSSFTDNFGAYEDWIELYNTSSTPVNLTNYCLSNKKTALTKWRFGNVTIAGNGFLRIWASGNNVVSGPNLHTNFTLTQCKPDLIIFSNAAALVQDSLTLKRTQVSHSRGRTTNGSAGWSVFLNPTPGTSNVSPKQNYVTTPAMNIAPGFYSGAQSVSITCPDPNTTIHYTTNGTTPNQFSTTYTGPVAISSTKVLRAIAVSSSANVPPSFVESNTYFINSPHTVSVISIFGDQVANLMAGNTSMPLTGIQYFDSSGTYRTGGYGSTNKHGNDSWNYNQRGIDFVSYDQYGYSDVLKHRFFNMKSRKEFQRIILKAAANDNYPFECPSVGQGFGDPSLFDGAHIRDQYVQTVAQKAGLHVDSRTWAPCVMYVNGQYWGVYDLREKVDDKDFTKYYYNSSADSLQMLKTWGGTWSAYGGTQAQTDWNALASYITSNSMAVQANYNYVDNLYNVKSLADYVILNSYCVTTDWLNWNTEWWRGNNVNCSKKKWRYCLWDEDATFHHYINYTSVPSTDANANPCDPESLGDPGGEGHVPILNALMLNPGFKQYYVMRYFDLINGGLSCARMTAILDSMVLQITPEMPKQIARWGGNMSAWQQNVQDLRNFILARCDSVTQHFSNCYNTTGPYTIKVNVDPPGAGTIDFNSNHLTSFLWTGLYPGNLLITLAEHPNPNYCFSYWEFKNNTPLPNNLDSNISVNLIATDSIVAHFIYNPKPTVTPINPKFCIGDSIQLTANGGATYTWTPSSTLSCSNCATPYANPAVTTIYTVTSINGPNCTNKNSQIVTVVPFATANYVDTITNIGLPVGVNFYSTSTLASTYSWDFGNGASGTGLNPAYSYSVAGTYSVTMIAHNSNGCDDTITRIIVITDTVGRPEIVMPNFFTPNGDGLNDYFQPRMRGMADFSCVIYDRWGKKIYDFSGANDKWGGQNMHGATCTDGTYYYIIKATDINKKAYDMKGFLQLIR